MMATIEDISKLLTTFKAEMKADMTEVIRREVRNIHEAQAQDFKQAEESLLPRATLASTSGMGKYYLMNNTIISYFIHRIINYNYLISVSSCRWYFHSN